VLAPPPGAPPRRPPSDPTPTHPTQAWAMEGAGSAETADQTGAARVATLRCPRPPRPPVRRFRSPLETGSRPPAHPPSTAHPRRFPHRSTAPTTRCIYSLVRQGKTKPPRLHQTQAVYCPPNRGRSRVAVPRSLRSLAQQPASLRSAAAWPLAIARGRQRRRPGVALLSHPAAVNRQACSARDPLPAGQLDEPPSFVHMSIFVLVRF